jgi:hypothetical protein
MELLKLPPEGFAANQLGFLLYCPNNVVCFGFDLGFRRIRIYPSYDFGSLLDLAMGKQLSR